MIIIGNITFQWDNLVAIVQMDLHCISNYTLIRKDFHDSHEEYYVTGK